MGVAWCTEYRMPDIISRRQSRFPKTTRGALWLLAQRAGDVIVGAAIVRLSRASGNQHFGRTGFHRIGVEALALLEALGLAKLVGAGLAVGSAVDRDRTHHPSRHHRRRLGQSRQALAGILGYILGTRVQIVDRLAWTLQGGQDRQGFLQHLSHFVDEARILLARFCSL